MCDTKNGEGGQPALTLDHLTEAVDGLEGVLRRDVLAGERLIVSTKNSIYELTACAGGAFSVRGGCYAREGSDAAKVEVLGCSAGGKALFTRIVAAPGLFLELSDGIRTTRIRTVRKLSATVDP